MCQNQNKLAIFQTSMSMFGFMKLYRTVTIVDDLDITLKLGASDQTLMNKLPSDECFGDKDHV